MSYVCPRCSYKKYEPRKYWVPDVRHIIDIPSAFAWTNWTLTDLTTDGSGDLVLSSGKLTGNAVSPQMINLTRRTTRYWDCTRVKLVWTHTSNDGKVEYYASNDGGTNYRLIKTADAIFRLNEGNELRQYKQAKYNDLRIRIVLSRDASGDTSPSVNKVVVTYNKIKL